MLKNPEDAHPRKVSTFGDDERLPKMLALQIAVVAEAGAAHVTVAVRGVAVGDLEIPAESYDGFALLALMNQYGNA